MPRKRNYTRFNLVTNFSNQEKFLKWWADKTHHKHMICRTPAFFRNNLLCAVRAQAGNKFIAAAGLISCLDHLQHEIFFENKLIVELCSNFVKPSHRGRDYAKKIINMRTEYALAHNYLPVIVTQEPRIMKIISELGWVEMRKYRKYDDVVKKVRYCKCEKDEQQSFKGERCEVCPFLGRSIWVKQF